MTVETAEIIGLVLSLYSVGAITALVATGFDWIDNTIETIGELMRRLLLIMIWPLALVGYWLIFIIKDR